MEYLVASQNTNFYLPELHFTSQDEFINVNQSNIHIVNKDYECNTTKIHFTFFSTKDTFTSNALGQYMCLIPTSGNGNILNQSFAMELDMNLMFNVSVNIHIGGDVNSMNSTTEYMQHLLWVQILTVSPTVGPSKLALCKMVQ